MRETNKKQTASSTTTIATPTATPDKTEAKTEVASEVVTDIKKAKEEAKMTTRPRRDSTSSLAAATQLKAQKDGAIGRTEINTSSSNSSSSSSNIHHNQVSSNKKPIVRMDRNKEVEKEATKYAASNSPPKNTPTTAPTKPPRIPPQPDPELGTTPKIEDNNRYTYLTNLILIQPNQNLISNDSQSLKLLYKHCKKLPTRQTALEILISIKPLTNKRHLFKNLNTTPATKNYLQRFKFFYLIKKLIHLFTNVISTEH